MRLTPENVARFYHIWLTLLNYVNDDLHLVASFPVTPGPASIPVEDVMQLRNALWEHDDLRERFIAENPAHLSAADLAIIESWQYRVSGSFCILRSLKKHTLFLSSASPAHVYGVLGLVSIIEDTLILPLPMYVQAVLLPFEHQIIYDTLLDSYNMMLGPGIRSGLQDQSRTLQEREGIITSLLPEDAIVSARGQRDEIATRNRKVFAAFRRDLRKGGLSDRMVDIHTATIEDFAREALLEVDPPRGILELVEADLRSYLATHPGSQPVVSFKRFLRFLHITERIDDELGDYLRRVLNTMGAEG